ncbi:LysE family translocator [Actinomadura sp. SCN-SB]|uniref:LysE family translocator n=1 Tax=Actinomadura sp. SCN-SB TaxID=3373092 RepID=UPI0037513E5A
MDAAFLITSLIVVVTPGTGVIYTLSAGLTQGRRAGVVAATGCTLGIVPHMAATISGVAALMHASATAFQVLKYLGVAYLLYMAWATLKDKDPIVVEGEAAPRTAATRMVVRGILINILNPKLTMFFFAFLPQFVDPGEEGSLLRMLELSAVFMLLTFVVFAAYGAVAAALRTHVISRPRVLTWMRRFFAGSFVALGAKLASATR